MDALYRIYIGFYFGPHHLIMDALLYFKEKVHRKKLQRADAIPLLFPRLLCHILEHMGYPIEPHLERRHHCREHFTLDQWTKLTERNSAEAAPPRPVPLVQAQPDQAQQDEHPTESISSTPTAPSMSQAASTDPPTTSPVPPVVPPPSGDFVIVFGLDFRAMVLLFRTLNATHNALFRHIRDIRAQ